MSTIHHLFELQVEKTPTNTAIVFNNSTMTYTELNNQANHLALVLRHHNVGPNVIVGIACNRSCELIVGILAILKAGGAYVPIQTKEHKRRDYILAETKAHIVLVDHDDFIPSKFIIRLDCQINREPTTNIIHRTQGHDLAYVLYTSGTTGSPKGIMMEHQSCVARILYMIRQNEMTEHDSLLFKTNITFDVSFSDIFCTLLSGAVLHITQQVWDISEIQRKLSEVTICHFVPSQFKVICQYVDFEDFPKLTKLMFSGEALDPQLLQPLVGWKGTILNYYGPTETGEVTLAKFKTNDKLTANIGRLFDGNYAYVVDNDFNPVPLNHIGQLCLGGTSLARGYLNRPDLTALQFVVNPFSTTGDKLYKTGDLVSLTTEHKLIYHGRMDDQIKINGQRVEPEEITCVIKQYLDTDSIVIGVNNVLVAYIIAKTEIDENELKQYLKERLPNYMIPAIFIQIDSIPLTANGKLDKSKLPPPTYPSVNQNTETEIEMVLVNIWDRHFSTKTNRHSNFFSLGGHSLMAGSIAFEINQYFNVDLKMTDVLALETIVELANKVNSLSKTTVSLPKLISTHCSPLGSEQKQIWSHLQLIGDSVIYNESWTITMSSPISKIWLEQSLNKLVERHAILRAKIFVQQDEPYQMINPYVEFKLPYVDLSHIENIDVCTEEARKLATAEAKKQFHLEHEPLIRFLFIKLRDSLYKLYIVCHHIIIDGISVYNILFPDLITIYKSCSTCADCNLHPINMEYIDYCCLNPQNSSSKFWEQTLDGSEAVALKSTRDQSGRGAVETFTFPEVDNKLGTTYFTLLLAVFNIVLYKYTGSTDICVASSMSGRPYKAVENVCGYFLNTVIFRNKLWPELTFEQFLKSVHQTVLNVHDNQHVPFSRVPNINSLLDVWLVLEPKLDQNDLGWQLSQTEIHNGTAKFPFVLELDPRPGQTIGRLEYRTDCFSQLFLQNFIRHFKNTLAIVTRQPNIKMSDIDILDTSERQQLLSTNPPLNYYPSNTTLHQLFENYVAKRPDQPAITCGNICLTYAQLNVKANQLSHLLIDKGVKPDNIVAIVCQRNIKAIICMLAILKAGGAYLYISSTYPTERIELMLAESKTNLVLTDATNNVFQRTNIFIDQDLSQFSANNPSLMVDPHHLAYVIFTSGSSGTPKGVMIEHASICDRLCWWQDYMPLTEADAHLLQFSLSFDGAVASLFWPLINGCRVIIPTADEVDDTVDLINRHQVSVLMHTPSMLKSLMVNPDFANLNSIRAIIFAGEVLTWDVVEKVQALMGCDMFNLYGPTENTIITTSFKITSKTGQTVPIGRPVSNTNVYILDADMNPVPVGVTGELYTSGIGVARGYVNQSNRTMKSFIDNPFDNTSKLYRTGDLCRWLEDLNIEYVGRVDDRLKIRGCRIEPKEIECVIKQHDTVNDVIVVLTGDKLVAYVKSENVDELRPFLKSKLPNYMIPSVFIQVKDFPLTLNGKLDLRSLPQIRHNFVAPRTVAEKILCSIAEKVLNVERIGVNDNLFELGLNSLNIFQLISLARKQEIFLTLNQINSFPTISLLALNLKMNILVEIRRAENLKSAIIFLPSAGGNISVFYPLISKLRHSNIFGLQILNEDIVGSNVQALAQKFVTVLMKELPSTKYILIGHSFGAILAYEMAVHFNHEMLDMVLMLDTSPQTLSRYKIVGNLKLYALLTFAQIHGVALEEVLGNSVAEKIEFVFGVLGQKFSSEQIETFVMSYINIMEMIKTYQSTPSKDLEKFILCRATDQCLFENSYGLFEEVVTRENLEAFKIVLVPGTHISMLEKPHVDVLADRIQDCLD